VVQVDRVVGLVVQVVLVVVLPGKLEFQMEVMESLVRQEQALEAVQM
jgi:hypothetical protein